MWPRGAQFAKSWIGVFHPHDEQLTSRGAHVFDSHHPEPAAQFISKPTPSWSLETDNLLRRLQPRFDSIQTAQDIWQDVLTAEKREVLGGNFREAIEAHKTAIRMVSSAWRCDPAEALMRLAEEYGTLPPPRLRRLRAEIGLPDSPPLTTTPAVPVWNKELGELWFQGQLARKIASTTRARAIVPILDAFEAQHWPPRIAGPAGHDRQCRRETVASLNDNLELIRFSMDGTTAGIRWKVKPAVVAPDPRDAQPG